MRSIHKYTWRPFMDNLGLNCLYVNFKFINNLKNRKYDPFSLFVNFNFKLFLEVAAHQIPKCSLCDMYEI